MFDCRGVILQRYAIVAGVILRVGHAYQRVVVKPPRQKGIGLQGFGETGSRGAVFVLHQLGIGQIVARKRAVLPVAVALQI